MRGQTNFVTGPDTGVTIPNGVIDIAHSGPDDLAIELTYPPVADWPAFTDPDTGDPIRSLHIDVSIGVLDATGAAVTRPDGTLLTLGPDQDWDVFCNENPTSDEPTQEPNPEPAIQLIAPTTYASCATTPVTDTVQVTGIGSRQLHGRIFAEYVTSPTTVEPVPGVFYPIEHSGPDDLIVNLTYPPVSDWPSFIDPDTGNPLRMILVTVQLVVLDSEGNYVEQPDGSVLILGPDQDWGVYCLDTVVEPPTDEPTPDVTDDPTEEATPEVTDEPTPEATEEPTVEPTPEPELILQTPNTYDACPMTGSFSDVLTIQGVGSRRLQGAVVLTYFTDSGGYTPPEGVYTVDHQGPNDYTLTITYPPIADWPTFTNPETGQPANQVHIDLYIDVLDSNGQPIYQLDGSTWVLGPGADWGVYCLTPPVTPEPPPAESTEEPMPESTEESGI